MKFFQFTEKALFISRPNRFVIICRLQGRTVSAYLPNPGRLRELLYPDSTLYLVQQSSSTSRMKYMAVAVEKNGMPVLLHTHLNNAVARHLIEQDRVPGLEGSVIVRPEVTIGNSRFDFLLRKGKQETVLEVKSCTLFSGNIGMFPDAPTLRGKKHLLELAALTGERKGAVLIIVHSPKVKYFMPDFHTDLEFSKALLSVFGKVTVKAVSAGWDGNLSLKKKTKELTIPWDLIRQESQDRGSYVLILQLKRKRKISIGNLGLITFQKGYYLYVGSARANLSKRIARHERKRKNLFWHIDYLREHADLCASLPVRANDDLECDIADELKKMSQWDIPGFGSSDCTCQSHLFAMSGDPASSQLFMNVLLFFRISRLESMLE